MAAGAIYFLVGPHPHSLMPSSASFVALADRHGRSRYLLSRGAPPPLADAVVCKLRCACRPAWPQALFTFSWGPTPTRRCRRLQASLRLQTGMAAGAI